MGLVFHVFAKDPHVSAKSNRGVAGAADKRGDDRCEEESHFHRAKCIARSLAAARPDLSAFLELAA